MQTENAEGLPTFTLKADGLHLRFLLHFFFTLLLQVGEQLASVCKSITSIQTMTALMC